MATVSASFSLAGRIDTGAPQLRSPASTGALLARMLPEARRRRPDAEALRFRGAGGQWTSLTVAEVETQVEALARALLTLGVEAGDRVCVLSETRPEWTYLAFAIPSVRATVVPIYHTSSAAECDYVIRHSEPRVVICDTRSRASRLDGLRMPSVEAVIVIDGPPAAGYRALEDVVASGQEVDPRAVCERRQDAAAADVATIIYTSGTTGPPKGCVIDHANVRVMLDLIGATGIPRPGDLIHLWLPLAHAYGAQEQWLAVDIGAVLVFGAPTPDDVLRELPEVQPTYLPAVPRVLEKVYARAVGDFSTAEISRMLDDLDALRKRQIGSRPVEPADDERVQRIEQKILGPLRAAVGGRLRYAVTGAAPIAPEVLRLFNAAGIPVLEGYGMTETTALVACSVPGAWKIGSVGRMLPLNEIRFAADGEILLRAPNVFRGYYRDPERTAEVLRNGWLRSGDLGHLDQDGFLYITGRKKEIIITAGGKNISPANWENELRQSPLISHAVVFGDRKPYLVALVTLDAGRAAMLGDSTAIETTIRELVDQVNARFAPVEQVKRFAILANDFSIATGELTTSMKLRRGAVYERHAEAFEGLYRSS